jgi:hypothetical protein
MVQTMLAAINNIMFNNNASQIRAYANCLTSYDQFRNSYMYTVKRVWPQADINFEIHWFLTVIERICMCRKNVKGLPVSAITELLRAHSRIKY